MIDGDATIRIPIEANPSALPEPQGCLHNKSTKAKVDLTYIEDTHRYVVELEASCLDCGARFLFDALPVGVMITKPCVSAFGTTATLPVTPGPIDPDWSPR